MIQFLSKARALLRCYCPFKHDTGGERSGRVVFLSALVSQFGGALVELLHTNHHDP